jgi:hypothetical protein
MRHSGCQVLFGRLSNEEISGSISNFRSRGSSRDRVRPLATEVGMPKRVIDFDAMWGSDKLASCAEWAQAEYAWLYGLADANGCFEITNLRVIWGRVAAIRRNLTIERLGEIFLEFQEKGLLFVWEHEGKRYAHWTGSDVPGRLPPPSWRMRLERFAPRVPRQELAEYMARFARGRAAFGGLGFRGGDFDESVSRVAPTDLPGSRQEVHAGVGELKVQLEGAQAQDLGLDLNENWDEERHGRENGSGKGKGLAAAAGAQDENHNQRKAIQGQFWDSNSKSFFDVKPDQLPEPGSRVDSTPAPNSQRRSDFGCDSRQSSRTATAVRRTETRVMSARDLALERELRVGQGPVCSSKGVKPEVIERDRLRQLAQAKLLQPSHCKVG